MSLKALLSNMSDMRTRYAMRLVGRLIILLIGIFFCIYDPAQFEVLKGANFFRSFTWLHLLWGIWVIDMAAQLFPFRTQISLGSQKLWKMRFEPIRQELQEKVTVDALKKYILSTTSAAYKVMLVWCPFRLMMGNRCCTTCRIFNWDHLMMFSPLLFYPSVYCWSLLGLSVAAWLVWEIFIFLHPERFWEGANAALTCTSCTDKLCTQYCRKLRPKKDDK